MSQLSLTYSRREWIIEILLVIAQSALLWPIANLLFAPFASSASPIDPWLILALVAIAALIPHLLYDRGIWGRSFSLVLAGLIAVTTLITIKLVSYPDAAWFDSAWIRDAVHSLVFEPSSADLVVWAPIGLTAFIWWLSRLTGPPGLERCQEALRRGTLIAAFCAIGAAVAPTGSSNTNVSLAIGLFFGATLTALAIARQGTEATRSRGRLLSTVLLPIVVIALLASLLGFLTTNEEIRVPSNWVEPLGILLDPIFQVLLIVFTGIVIVIAFPILWLLSLGNGTGYRPTNGWNPTNNADQSNGAVNWHPPDAVRYILATLFLVAIFYGVTRFGLYLTRREIDDDENGERTIGPGHGLKAWLRRVSWPFGLGGRNPGDPLAGLRNDPAWANTVRIRETYASYLRWSRDRQLPRAPAETASELDRRVSSSLRSAEASSALADLSRIYEAVRYGALPATGQQAEAASNAWSRLKHAEEHAPEH